MLREARYSDRTLAALCWPLTATIDDKLRLYSGTMMDGGIVSDGGWALRRCYDLLVLACYYDVTTLLPLSLDLGR